MLGVAPQSEESANALRLMQLGQGSHGKGLAEKTENPPEANPLLMETVKEHPRPEGQRRPRKITEPHDRQSTVWLAPQGP